ncbi:hypothetical protein CEUSTIGMA_g7035.t1 [Chlamydomonas eustigma]|uniref:EF-hand domain-containing protein n=1 Tax=Chlamydomonas eustigma TaxID=1157962 RepID=A0A250X939_9CHLO|nr:hypothetical protein CEUSTIGMA_g7035.t1 [Chlamydomonas eustigma]|eukprot:GAX79594.1 hypothetical protein CEUSTIGMA_g7035.t1 [Chlamydomonas eustigma]
MNAPKTTDVYEKAEEPSARRGNALLQFVEHPDVELLVNFVILLNLAALAAADPVSGERDGRNGALWWIDLACNIFFTMEILMRMLGLGAIPPWGIFLYFQEPWNCFDFVMVSVGWLQVVPSQSNLNSIKSLRALRPLRTISRFESTKFVIRGILASVPLLSAVYVLIFVFILVFGVVGLMAFTSAYHYQCIWDEDGVTTEAAYFNLDDPDMAGCGSWRSCPSNFTCTHFESQTCQNTAGWDNIGLAALTIQQCLTTTGWDFIAYRAMSSISPFAIILFLVLIMLGTYLLMNLIIAVLKLKFARFCKLESAKNLQRQLLQRVSNKRQNILQKLLASTIQKTFPRRKLKEVTIESILNEMKLMREAAKISDMDPYDDETCKTATASGRPVPVAEGMEKHGIVNVAEWMETHGIVNVAEWMETHGIGNVAECSASGDAFTEQGFAQHGEPTTLMERGGLRMGGVGTLMLPMSVDQDEVVEWQSSAAIKLDQGRAVGEGYEAMEDERLYGYSRTSHAASSEAGVMRLPSIVALRAIHGRSFILGREAVGGMDAAALSTGDTALLPGRHYSQADLQSAGGTEMPVKEEYLGESKGKKESADISVKEFQEHMELFLPNVTASQKSLLSLQYRLHLVIHSRQWSYFLMLCIAASVGMLAGEYAGMSQMLLWRLVQANWAFTLIFFIDLLLLLFSSSPVDLVKNVWVWIQVMLIIFGAAEVIWEGVGGVHAVEQEMGLRVIRAMRVLRMLNFIKASRPMMEVSTIILKAMISYAAIAVLIVLFWIVFGIIGMNVFGAMTLDLTYLGIPGYPDFSTFLSSMVIAFQVMTLENYQQTMYSVVRASNYGAVSWFLTWIFLGKYTFLSLFLAVTLEAFDTSDEGPPPTSYPPEPIKKVKKSHHIWSLPARIGSQTTKLFRVATGRMTEDHDHGEDISGHRDSLFRPKLPSMQQLAQALRSASFSAAPSETHSSGQLSGSPQMATNGPQNGLLSRLTRGVSYGSISSQVAVNSVLEPRYHGNLPIVATDSIMSNVSGGIASWQGASPGSSSPQTQECSKMVDSQESIVFSCLKPAGSKLNLAPTPRMLPKSRSEGFARGRAENAAAALAAAAELGPGADELQHNAASTSLTIGSSHQVGLSGPSLRYWTHPSTHVPEAHSKSRSAINSDAPRVPPQGPYLITSDLRPTGSSEGGGPSFSVVYNRSYSTGSRTARQGVTWWDTKSSNGSDQASDGHQGSRSSGLSRFGQQSLRVSFGADAHGGEDCNAGDNSLLADHLPDSEKGPDPDLQHTSAPAQAHEEEDVFRLVIPQPELLQNSISPSKSNMASPNNAGMNSEPMVGATTSSDGAGGIIAPQWMGREGHVRVVIKPSDQLGTAVSTMSDVQEQGAGVRAASGDNVVLESGGGSMGNLGASQYVSWWKDGEGHDAAGAPIAEVGSINAAGAPIAEVGSINAAGAPIAEVGSINAAGAPIAEVGSINAAGAPIAEAWEGVGASFIGLRDQTLKWVHSKSASPEALSPVVSGYSHLRRPVQFPDRVRRGTAAKRVPTKATSGRAMSGNRAASAESNRSGMHYTRSTSGGTVEQLRALDLPSYGFRGASEMEKERAEVDAKKVDPDIVPLSGVSLYFMTKDNVYRKLLYRIVTSSLFDWSLLLIVLLNCTTLIFESPINPPDSLQERVLYYSNIAFTSIYCAEAAAKIVAYNFKLYMSKAVNMVDFFIAVTSVLELILDVTGVVGNIRALRVFQPLKVITNSKRLREVTRNILMALVRVGQVTLMCTIFVLMFAIAGMQYFSGRFNYCQDAVSNLQVQVSSQSECSLNSTYPLVSGSNTTNLQWSNLFPNFDNLGNSLLILMVATSLNGYTPYMVQAMSAPSTTTGVPVLNQNWSAFFYFIIFNLFCALILLNLFTGVIFTQFCQIKEKQGGSNWLTDDQRQWIALQEAVFRLRPLDPKKDLPQNKLRRTLFYVVRHKYFWFMMLIVSFSNCLVMTLWHWNQSTQWTNALLGWNLAFVLVYIMEFLMKIVALGPEAYWKDGWNRFDLLIVIVGILDLALDFLGSATVFRVLRVLAIEVALRSLKLISVLRNYQGIKLLYVTLVVSMPNIISIGIIITLIFFMYAYLGVQAFASLPFLGALNYQVNFQFFWNAQLVLLRIATTDNWSDFFFQMIPGNPSCYAYEAQSNSTGCGSWLSIPYCISFLFLIAFIMLNLFMAVIIEAYEKYSEMMHWEITPMYLDELVWIWVEYDDGSGTITFEDLFKVLQRVGLPLGLSQECSEEEIVEFASGLKLPYKCGRVQFHSTVFELVRNNCEAFIPPCALKEVLDKQYLKFVKAGQREEDNVAQEEAALHRLQQIVYARDASVHSEAYDRNHRLLGKASKRWQTLQNHSSRYGSISGAAKGDSSVGKSVGRSSDISLRQHLHTTSHRPHTSSTASHPVSLPLPQARRFAVPAKALHPTTSPVKTMGESGSSGHLSVLQTRSTIKASEAYRMTHEIAPGASYEQNVALMPPVTLLAQSSLYRSIVRKDSSVSAGSSSAADSPRKTSPSQLSGVREVELPPGVPLSPSTSLSHGHAPSLSASTTIGRGGGGDTSSGGLLSASTSLSRASLSASSTLGRNLSDNRAFLPSQSLMLRAAEQLAEHGRSSPPSPSIDQQASIYHAVPFGRDSLVLSPTLSLGSIATSPQDIRTTSSGSMRRDLRYEPKYKPSIPQEVPTGSPHSSQNSSAVHTSSVGGLMDSPTRVPSLTTRLEGLPSSPSTSAIKKHLQSSGGSFSRTLSPLGMNSRLRYSGSFAQHGEGCYETKSTTKGSVTSGEITMVLPIRKQVSFQTEPRVTGGHVQTEDMPSGSNSTGVSSTATLSDAWEDRRMGSRTSS